MEFRPQEYVAANEREYGPAAARMRWVSPADAEAADAVRAARLSDLAPDLQWAFHETKPFLNALSPGCRACGEGTWNCLFVNGICNARCFYCPAAQQDVGEPTSNTVAYPTPDDYLHYVRRFDVRGVSLSGGEPLLTLDRTLRYLRAVRPVLGSGGYLWLYTNGRLATDDVLAQLADTGLDEIRFDLSATRYDTRPLARAARRIPAVTVEVPAIPEHVGRLRERLPALVDAGVRYLNLHELRATAHNLPRLRRRGYTFRHGPRVTVLESELAAFELLGAVQAGRLPIGAQYCSSIFKHRHQTVASRRRHAELVRRPYEGLTEAGLLRRVVVNGPFEAVSALVARLKADPRAAGRFEPELGASRVLLDASLLGHVDPALLTVRVSYALATLTATPSRRFAAEAVQFGPAVRAAVERQPARSDVVIAPQALASFAALIGLPETRDGSLPGGLPQAAEAADGGWSMPALAEVAPFERLQRGLYPIY